MLSAPPAVVCVKGDRGSSIRPRFPIRTSLALPGAVLLSLLLTAQTVAATWSLPDPLALGSGYAGGLVTIGTATAVAAYSNGGAVVVRRTGDAGATWSSPVQLSSTSGTDPAIAGRGRHVDVAWLEDGRVRYARSGDGGATFGPSVALSPVPVCGECELLSVTVARGPDGLVAVAWSEEVGDIRSFIRVSRDGGVSFRARKSLGWVIWPKVAVGRGVVYVEYRDEFYCCFFPLLLRRSLDAGASWSAPRLIAKSVPLNNDTSITAAGDEAYVAWTGPGIRYRRTTNKGATWSTRLGLTSPLGDKVFPVISLRGGVVRALFTNWQMSGVFYRKSTNGTTWSRTEVVSDSGFPLGIGLAGHALALYQDDQGIYVRARAH